MGKSQRTKGAVYEREIALAFSKAFQAKFSRNIGQSRDGGNDIDVGPLVVECKRRKTLTTLRKWMDQAIVAAKRRLVPGTDLTTTPAIPMIVCREDNGESLVVLRLADFLTLIGPVVSTWA